MTTEIGMGGQSFVLDAVGFESCPTLQKCKPYINLTDCPIAARSDIRLEVQTMRLSSHPNVLVCYTSFVRDTDLWLVTQLMRKGSSLHCLQSARARLLTDAAAAAAASSVTTEVTRASSGDAIREDGGPLFAYTSDDSVLEGGLAARASIINPEFLIFESHITYILYETLLGLEYIHDNGQIHRDVKAGNILLDSRADVRIADFGVSSWLIDGGNRREHTTTFVGTPCWMAPEVMEQLDGYDYKADIWSLGITALELCKGYAPYAKFAPMKVLLLTIQEDPPSLDTYNDGDDVGMWSESFRSMVRLCLQKDPNRRPTCHELLAHRHFRPLADADGRTEWRLRTKTELCDVVIDVDKLTVLPDGTTTIQCTAKKVRPAGTSWILPGKEEKDDIKGSSTGTSPVDAMSSLKSSSGRRDDQFDFYDEFEEQTGGENFNRESLAIKSNATKEEEDDEFKKKEEEDDMNDFFDEFEKTTGGENFRPGRHVR
jgi:serine/threonine-protein kinase OSR1/STK39